MLNILMEAMAANWRAMDKMSAEMGQQMARGWRQARQEGQTVILATEDATAAGPAPAPPQRLWRRRYFPDLINFDWLGRPLYKVAMIDQRGELHNLAVSTFKRLEDARCVALQLQAAYNEGLRVGSNGELPATGENEHGDDEDNGAGEQGGSRSDFRATSDAGAARGGH